MGFSNSVIGGAAALIRAAIKSPNFVSGSAGWQISKDGSAEFNSLALRGVFSGTNYVINNSGEFFYSGVPALGNLVLSITQTAGTDGQGNAYLSGVTVYASSPSFLAAQFSVAEITWYSAPGAGGPWTSQTNILATTAGGSNLLLNANNQTFIGASGTCNWQDGTQQLVLPAGGGPFIDGESFHGISLPGGLSGTFRVKELPWNAIWLDVDVAFTYSGSAQTFTTGSLPSAAYYPNQARRFPGRATGTISSTTVHEGVTVPTSGGLTVLVPAGSGSGNMGLSVIYPTN